MFAYIKLLLFIVICMLTLFIDDLLQNLFIYLIQKFTFLLDALINLNTPHNLFYESNDNNRFLYSLSLYMKINTMDDTVAQDRRLHGHTGTVEQDFDPYNGVCMLLITILLFPLALIFCFLGGFFTLQPKQSMVLTLCGKYKGTVKQTGFFWVHGFYQKRVVSLSLNNFNGHELKVNDKSGNPIKIAAVVVWRVRNTAKAVFDVADYNNFVVVQYESALRELATSYAYESQHSGEISLRSGHDTVNKHLVKLLHDRLELAGIEVLEARITTLAYSEEIAGIMLQRQQAEAVLGAKEKIVKGAVGIIEDAIASFRVVHLSANDQSILASNLLVVLCNESGVKQG